MKNTATPGQASETWAAAMRRFDRDLQRRGAAEHRRLSLFGCLRAHRFRSREKWST
jgi:hypothetical protein